MNFRGLEESRLRSYGFKKLTNSDNEFLKLQQTSTGIIPASQKIMDFKKRILVVEDVADSRELLAHLFRHSGYEVEEAARGLAAIAQVRATRPDLIIMDLGLPGSVSGDDVTARLKADPSTRDIPIIVYTAYPKGAPIVERARAVGAAEILHKPLSLRIVKATVDRYLSTEYMLHPANGRSRSFTVLSGGKGK